MKKFYFLPILALFALSGCKTSTVSITDMTVELLENPVGVAAEQPRFSWQIASEKPDLMQTAYRIKVAADAAGLDQETNLIWDSGVVGSDQSVFVSYAGPKLESRKDYWWKVLVTTNKGDSVWSAPAHWSMALLDSTDWKAQWIGIDSALNATDVVNDVRTRLAARYLRKEFPVEGNIASARLYISGLGMYECYLNGAQVGEGDLFAPTISDYTKCVYYNTFDVTDKLKEGENTIGVILGNGRFFSMRMITKETMPGAVIPSLTHYGYPKLLAQLEITYKDGKQEIITSDNSWKLTTNGPIIANNEFDGEEYDAHLEMKGWNKNGFDDKEWIEAKIVGAPQGTLTAQTNPNIKTMETITPVAINKLNDSTLILDMGQNMVGWLAVSLKGVKDKPIRLRFAETLQPDGSLYMANLRGALVTDIYTPAQDGMFSWEPKFTYHGFRFVEITGLDYVPELKEFKGRVNYDEMETTGSFACSDSTLNQIYHNAYWGIRGNYRGMPTDCPQRDERMGWLGDRAMGSFGESYIFRPTLLYEKWLRDIQDSQRPNGQIPDVSPTYWPFYSENVTWPAAYPCIVDMLYNQYGDVNAVKEHYASLKKWMEYIRDTHMTDYIIVKDVYGDWCMPPESPELIHSMDPTRVTDGRLLGTSFYYRLLNMMAKFAAVSGHNEDIPAYNELAQKVKEAYNKMFLNAETGQYANNTVTANLVSLMQGLVPDSLQAKVFANVVEKTKNEFDSHVSTGLIGIQFLMRGLTRNGEKELAYTIATNRSYPSWGYMIDKGATTIWELWNGDTANPAMNSGNHVMLLGDLMSWYFEDLAGIKSDSQQVGFKKIIMEPCFPENLDWVDASTETLYGKVASHWQKTAEGLKWEVEIPANTTALIRIPATSADAVTENGQPLLQNPAIKAVQTADTFVSAEVGSGKYSFNVKK